MIQIIDNFLPDTMFSALVDETTLFKYTHGHWSSNAHYENHWLHMDLNNSFFFTNTMMDLIKDTTNQNFHLDRVYMNGMTYGCTSSYHTDSSRINDKTFLLFIHECYPDNADEIGGYFYYKDANNDIRCIEPLKNRAIFFNGNILHKGECFHRDCKILRQSIAWKLKSE